MDAVLSLKDFSVSYGPRVILHQVDFSIPSQGVLGVMGPGGAGKSTLIRTLAGLNAAQPNWTIRGCAQYRGLALEAGPTRPAIVTPQIRLAGATLFEFMQSNIPNRSQHTRLEQKEIVSAFLVRHGQTALAERMDASMYEFTKGEKRLAAILREVLSEPALLCVDEPTAELSDEDAEPILVLIEALAKERAIIFITHNQSQARRLCSQMALVAAGQLVECAPTETFFNSPKSEHTRNFVKTGGCSLPSLNARPEELEPSDEEKLSTSETITIQRSPRATTTGPIALLPLGDYVPARSGPNAFHWLVPGRLGGSQKPGLLRPIETDLRGLQRCEVTWYVDLRETSLPEEKMNRFGIQLIHFPVVDMDVPTIEAAWTMVNRVERLISYGDTVSYGCKAGLGRTGTLLCCHLIYAGRSSKEAVNEARRINQYWVQSQKQLDFLDNFSIHCRQHN